MMTLPEPILDDLQANGLIERIERTVGKRTVTICRPTRQGIAFCENILEPYEKMFPRRRDPASGHESNGALSMLLLV